MKSIWPVAFVLILLVLSLVFGCSPAQTPSPPSTATPVASQPKYGGTLSASTSAPAGFDVHTRAAFSPLVGRLVYSNLVRMDPTKVSFSPQNIVGDLAERWEISSDGKMLTFFLRKDVKWHDGKAFTAGDVVYSMQKMVDPKRSGVASSFTALDKMEKVDDYTVRMSLKTPSPSFFVQLASPYTMIFGAHTASIDPRTSEFLVGTGPFKLAKLIPSISYELVKNPDYYGKDASGNRLPYLDGVNFHVIAGSDAMVDAFATKRLDSGNPFAGGLMSQDQLDTMKAKSPGAVFEWFRPRTGSAGNYMNHTVGPLKDARVRRALSLLYEPKGVTVAAYGSEEWATYGTAFFSPTYGLSTAEINKITWYDRPEAERAAEAKRLMAEAGYANGFPLKMVVSSSAADSRRYFQWLADLYRRYLKIEPTIDPQDQATLTQSATRGDFGIIHMSSGTWMGDPDELRPMLETGGPANFSRYSNPEVDRLFQQQSVETDLAKRKQLTQQIERMLLTDAAVVPRPERAYAFFYWPHVKGAVYQEGLYGSATSLDRMWLDK